MKTKYEPDKMGINLGEIPESEEEDNNIHFGENNEHEKSVEGSEHVDYYEPNKAHQFYFVKFWPNQEPESDFEIEKAEKLIQELHHLELQITKELDIQSNQIREIDLVNLHLQLEDTGPYSIHTALSLRKHELKRLQKVLDELCFGYKSYQTRIIDSDLKSKHHELDNHKLQYQLIHGCKSLAEEKRQMRDIKASQRRGEDHHMCRTISLGEVDWSDLWKYYELTTDSLRNTGITDSERDSYPRGIKQLKLKAEKCVYNAALKGKSLNSLGLKQAIEDKIKIIYFELEILRKKRKEIRAKIYDRSIGMKRNALTKVRDSLNKKLMDINQRKKEACQFIINLRKQYGKENACYYQNRLLLSKAMALADKKDVAALQKLSHTEGEKFMSHWNNNKAFRDDYKKRATPWLSRRQLSSDGRMEDFGHEDLLVLLTPPSLKRETVLTMKELKSILKENVFKARYPYEISDFIGEYSLFD